MKKTFLFLLMLVCSINVNSQSPVKPKIYLNPITYSSGSGISQSEWISASNNYLMGISKAKHVSITRGHDKIDAKAAAQKGFDYLLDVNINSITVEKSELLSSDDSKSYVGKCSVEHKLFSAKTGKVVVSEEITGSCVNSTEKSARFESTTLLNNDALAMIDDALPIIANQINVEEADDDKVETVIINLGSEAGARKGMMFAIQQISGSGTTDIATARLEQILGGNSRRLNIYTKKGGEKNVLNALNNADENTVIVARSRALKKMAAMGKDMLKSFGFTTEDKGDSYPSDINRKSKPKVAINHLVGGSDLSSESAEALKSAISESFTECSTINPGETGAKTIDAAAAEGWDALIDITITDVSTKRGKDVKTASGTKPVYIGSVTMSLYAINVATQAGINLRNIEETSTGNTPEQAIANTFKRIAKPARKFFDDVFPVESRLEAVTKFNKRGDEAKEASLSIGSAIGVEKNMKFDIFKQNLTVGEDSREVIGHGEVKTAPEQGSSIMVIQEGGKQIASILQSGDPDVGIIVVSRGHINKVGAIAKGLGLGGIF